MALTANVGIGALYEESGATDGAIVNKASSTVTLDGSPVPGLAPEFAQTTLAKAFEGSIVGRLIPSEPMPLTGKDIPVFDSNLEVGLTGEAAAKPQIGGASINVQHIRPAKVAGILVVSKELAQANPSRMLDLMQADMRNAIARAVDNLVLFNRDLRGTSYAGVNKAVFGSATQHMYVGAANKINSDFLLDAYQAAISETADPNGWIFDPVHRATLTRLVQTSTQKDNTLPDLRGGASVVAGLPAYYTRAFARDAAKNPSAGDASVAGVLGDWSKVRWGFVERLDITRSTEATVSGVSMFETNQIAFLIEAILGWTVLDQAAFVALHTGNDPTP